MNQHQTLQAVRAEIGALTDEILAVRRCALPMDAALAGVRQQIESGRARFAATLDNTARNIAVATRPWTMETFTGDAMPWLAYSLGDVLLTDLEQRVSAIRADAGNPPTLPAAERAAKLDELERRRYALEQKEEAIVAETGAARRPGVTPAAVLGIPFDAAKLAGVLE